VDALTSSGLNYCLIRGAALSPWLYPSTHIRHNHAIDIVVDSADTHAVALALQRIGLSTGTNRPQATQVSFLHHSELPIIVHTQLLHLPEMGYMGTFAGKSTTRQLADRSFSTLDTTSHCLQVLGNASCSTQNGNLRWVIDAFHLMINADEIDWPEFWRIARQLGIDGFCTAALRYLANDLRIQLPDQANAEWHASGGVGGRGDRRRFFAALHCTRGSHTRVLRAMRNAPLLAMAYLQFAIFPSADYLAFRYGVVDSAQRVAWHADRPRRAIRYFLRRQTND
jgi:hypothetical protein